MIEIVSKETIEAWRKSSERLAERIKEIERIEKEGAFYPSDEDMTLKA